MSKFCGQWRTVNTCDCVRDTLNMPYLITWSEQFLACASLHLETWSKTVRPRFAERSAKMCWAELRATGEGKAKRAEAGAGRARRHTHIVSLNNINQPENMWTYHTYDSVGWYRLGELSVGSSVFQHLPVQRHLCIWCTSNFFAAFGGLWLNMAITLQLFALPPAVVYLSNLYPKLLS